MAYGISSAAMATQGAIRVLHLEDSDLDAELVACHLEGLTPPVALDRVAGRTGYVDAISEGGYDLILADYCMPDFDGLSALAIARERLPDTPFIMVSGVSGEDFAVDALHRGATDYIIKERLKRLPVAVSRALDEARRRADHRATAASLQISQAQFRAVFESRVVGLCVFDAANREALMVNDRMLELLGCTRAAFEQGKRGRRPVPLPELGLLARSGIMDARAGTQHPTIEMPLERRDGTHVWLRLHSAPMPGFLDQIVVSVQDISERKQGERERERLLGEVRQERSRLAQVLEHTPVGLIVAKAGSGEIVSYNRQAERILGHSVIVAERIGDYAAYGAVHDDGRRYSPEEYPVARAVRTGARVEQDDLIYRRGDGRLTRLSMSAAPIGAPGAPPEAVVCAFLDVDERRRAEAMLRGSEARFRALADSMPQLVWTARPDGHVDYFNARWYAYTGAEPAACEGEGWAGFVHPDDLSVARKAWRRSVETGEPYEVEYRLLGSDGCHRWFIGRALPMRDEAGATVRWYGTSTDVEEQKRTNRALAAIKESLRLAQEAAGVGTWERNLATEDLRWSPATYRLYGCDPSRCGPSYQAFSSWLHPDDRDHVTDAMARLMRHPEPLDLEFRVVPPDGTLRWILSRCRSEIGPDGGVAFIRGADIDVTERKMAEERERLLMREVDHRAKNTLAVVQSLVRLTRADTKQEFVAAIEGRVTAMARAHSLLARDKWVGADLATLLEQEFTAVARDQLRVGGPEVTFSADAVLPVGLALHELATNAAKYGALSSATGCLDIEWRIEPKGGALVLAWRESGGPPTSKPTRRGFGSTLVRTSVEEQLGGRLQLEWREEGLALEMRIPARHWVRQSVAAMPPPADEPERGLFPRRVLVVEDNALIAMELEELLRGFGCDVVGPALSLEDAELLATVPDIDGAVLDLNLHGQSSLPLAERLLSRGIGVLFCSGYEEMLEPGWEDAPRVRKPFSRRSLMAGLDAMVERMAAEERPRRLN